MLPTTSTVTLVIALTLCAISPRLFAKCEYSGDATKGLAVRPGFVEFLSPAKVAALKSVLPRVASTETDAALRAENTIWYDESSMVFVYQDSIEVVTGVRANCVGRTVGENNLSNPGIAKLINYFGPDYRFLFPFRKAAGTDNVANERVVNFWVPPTQGNTVLPVKYWKHSSRGHWYWTFPLGTLFGEVLMQLGPDGQEYVFEIRTRKRYAGGWAVNVFRPFVSAHDLASAVKTLRPDYALSASLRNYVSHLENPNTLVATTWKSKAYGKVFPAIDGALDPLPDPGDFALLKTLLRDTPFVSAEGAIWKETAQLQSYAPASASASASAFNIVPKGYEMGVVPVNEVSCTRCHSETSRKLITFEFDVQLYGEVWGEDQIFTWHPFEPNRYIYGTWDETDGSRKANPRLAAAGLIKNEKPSSTDPLYKPLKSAFDLPPAARGPHHKTRRPNAW